MKKTILFLLMACLSIAINAQGTLSAKKQVLEMVMMKTERFAEYLEKIGTTNAVSWEEKTRIREKEVPHLFLKYEERKMITNYGPGGKNKTVRKMPSYFERLQQQSMENYQPIQNIKTRRFYEVTIDYHASLNEVGDDLNWKFVREYSSGCKEYRAELKMNQIYLIQRMDGVEVVYSKEEEDQKTIIVTMLVCPNGTTKVALGDVTRIERMNE